MTRLSYLERVGLSSLHRPTDIATSDDPVEVLNPSEQAALRRIQRSAVLRAALAGALSALATLVAGQFAPSAEVDPIGYWVVVGSVTAVASLLELGYLYVDALRAVREMAAAAGLRVLPGEDADEVGLALARAALELPTPPVSILGVDSRQEASRAYLLVAGLLYKLKVTVTNFLIKAVLRRALGRFATRAYLDVVAVPVTALWNAVVTFWVVREARLRIVGTSAAAELHGWIGETPEKLELALRTIACVIVQARQVHPNIEALAVRLLRHAPGEPLPSSLGDRGILLARLAAASPEVQASTLRAAVAACVIDGRLSRRERKLLSDLYGAAGREVPWAEVRALGAHLTHGDGLRRDLLDALG